jgi:hypothetical protein
MTHERRSISLPKFFFTRLRSYSQRKGKPLSALIQEWCAPRLAEVDPEFRKYQEAKSKLEEMER